jgi:hypothetical protein
MHCGWVCPFYGIWNANTEKRDYNVMLYAAGSWRLRRARFFCVWTACANGSPFTLLVLPFTYYSMKAMIYCVRATGQMNGCLAV